MWVRRLWLHDFRSYSSLDVQLSPTFTAVVGGNGSGKTNLIEAVAWLASLSSFRGASADTLVRQGTAAAVIRAEVEREGRDLLIEAELTAGGRNRVRINRQVLRRSRELLGALRVTVFTPDDLVVVKGGPGERRRFLDDAVVACDPRQDASRIELERILRQRNALLKTAAGSLDDDAAFTLDVWDTKLAEVGETIVAARLDLLNRLTPLASQAYAALSGSERASGLELAYHSEWRAMGMAEALRRGRANDVRRGVSTVGPHRDDVLLSLNDLPARAYASQGEQRTLALALRLATHRVVTDVTGSPPVLLLDDVFSELDNDRSSALLANLPPGQMVMTTASKLPAGAKPDVILEISDGGARVADSTAGGNAAGGDADVVD